MPKQKEIPKLTHAEFKRRVERIRAMRDAAELRWRQMRDNSAYGFDELTQAALCFEFLDDVVTILTCKASSRRSSKPRSSSKPRRKK